MSAPASNVVPLPVLPEADPALRFEAVYRRHFRRVYRWIARIAPGMDAEDLSQEVFLVVHRRLPEFEGNARITTWLFQITYHVVGSHLRRRRNDLRLLHPSSWLPSRRPPEPFEELALEREARALRSAIEDLDLKHRSVLVLFELEEWPGKDIAETLQIPLETVYSRLHYARRKLAAKLEHVRAR
jgi:RNA polymerase sigma-70 factor (ECF subfamily)